MGAIEIEGLTKSYRTGGLRRTLRPALTDVSLSVGQGEIFGYLGPNGSGKTTTLKLLMGMIFPDRGTATILGSKLDDPTWRSRSGYLPEQPYLYDYLTPAEYLDYVGRLFGMAAASRGDRGRQLLDLVGLGPWSKTPLRRFSKGMLQRAGIAQALMNDPEILFLDEPMSGLDPIGRHLVRTIILDLKKAGKTVFFSTHILSDAEALCDRVGLLAGGKLISVGPISEILNLDVNHFDVLLASLPSDAAKGLPSSVVAHSAGERYRLEVPEAELHAVLEMARASHARVLSVTPIRQSLEDYFVDQMRAHQGREPTWTAE